MLEKGFALSLLIAMTKMTEFIEGKEDPSIVEKRFCLVFQFYKRDILNGLRESSSISPFVVEDSLFDELFQQVTLLEKEISRKSDITMIEKIFEEKVNQYIKKINAVSPLDESL